jgi:ATP-dependent helicase/nuclease subunit A
MSARRDEGLKPLHRAQALAASPGAHVWLSASAGTGKTHVLTARVLRLLLGGVAPEQILCLTFTKAGAAEMAERIHNRLALWVQMEEEALFADLDALGEPSGPEARERARTLFARVLEATGGGLRIQTIHSFCQGLLAAFPLEAGLAPGFTPLDDRARGELARTALVDLLIGGDPAVTGAIQALSLRMGEGDAERYLQRCAGSLAALDALGDDPAAWLLDRLGLPGGDLDAYLAAACADGAFDCASLRRVAAVNAAWGGVKGGAAARAVNDWLALDPAGRAAALESLHLVFWTTTGTPRKVNDNRLKIDPAYADMAATLGEATRALLALRDRVAWARFAGAGLLAGRAFARAYAAAKRRAGAVDFDDLIETTVALLREANMAEWIRYKLDQSIDHVLVDEAQDTNRNQWLIVNALVEDYFAGLGARDDRVRTLFAVGDVKQAIFGFQGTSPRAFMTARDGFRARALIAGQDFHELPLAQSFRSTPPVLDAVDAVLAEIGPAAIGLDAAPPGHASARRHPGRVLLWPPVRAVAPEGEEEEDDTAEGEEDWAADHVRALATRVARQVRAWLDAPLWLKSRGRPLRAGDVMVLVRSRGELARLIVARLHEEGVAVAGVDRLRLQTPLGVRDLLAAIRFAVQPEDDLNLANLLVSPLIGWSQDALMHRAIGRGRLGLWRHLRATGDEAMLAPLRDLLARADFMTPHALIDHILVGPMRGRRRLLTRLGLDAADPIDELANAALLFEGDGAPSLQRFIDWFDRGDADIKREAAEAGDAVRVLTVHGAKGLEAPLVILANAAFDPDQPRRDATLVWEEEGIGKLPLPRPRKADAFGPVADAVAAAALAEREEHWRLLYVAMTRAEEVLAVAGALGPRSRGVTAPDSWHARIERALRTLGAAERDDPLWGRETVWEGREPLPEARPERMAAGAAPVVDRPAWLHAPAPIEARPPRPLAPSALPEDVTPDPPPPAALRAAAERGTRLHALFERLPAVAPADRAALADRWLASQGLDDAAARAALVDHALAVIGDARFAGLFGPQALAEAPVAAVVNGQVIAGTVDRLLVTDDLVQIVDFKTGRFVPADVAAVPVPHMRQMAAYAAALAVIFPDRRVEAALLYTAGPRLVVLSAGDLAAHKPGLAD